MLKNLRDYWTIKKSGLFDPIFYLMNYPDVRRADINPLMHFIQFGWKEGRIPSEKFDAKYYLDTYDDVKTANINPLLHYIRWGKKEGRITNSQENNFLNQNSTLMVYNLSSTYYRIILKVREIGLFSVIKKGIYTLRYEGVYSFWNKLFQQADVYNIAESNTVDLSFDKSKNKIDISERKLIISDKLPKLIIRSHDSVDIVICVHNALEDFRNCIKSIKENTSSPYRIIIVDDGSNQETKDYLAEVTSSDPTIRMIINSPAKGYTKSANLGLLESKTKFVVLMNSDVIVTPGWLEKMNSIFFLDSRIGMVGPLSNTASWQSIPELFENNDWAKNSLPEDYSINKFSDLLLKYLFPVFPEVPFLNGFCMMIRKELFADIGYFDEEAFPIGYGEEDDFVLRARQAGWQIRWADNTYLFHAQSRSFTDKKRLELSSFGTKSLIAKHGESIISEGCEYLMNSPIIISIREHAKHILDREKLINLGKKLFKDKRILFVLPIAAPGGGANVIFDEALAMIRMGVDVRVFNLEIYRQETIKGYPNLKIPVTYGKVEDLQNLLPLYDAVIATSNISVVWIKDNFPKDENPIFGYYVQDFEPLFYNPLSEDYYKAYQSYILDPFLIRFTKTEWTRLQLLENIGVDSKNIGISVDTDLFRPIKKKK